MIDYIGDISRNDARLLEREGLSAEHILEFGVGASTQVFATSCGPGRLTSLDTSPEWIEKTRRNLKRFTLHRVVDFQSYETFFEPSTYRYDLIFVDGIDDLRYRFAVGAWNRLAPGGRMLFHDTRRREPHGTASFTDLEVAFKVAHLYAPWVKQIDLNKDQSNITVIYSRREPLFEEDYNAIERRTPEQRGYGR